MKGYHDPNLSLADELVKQARLKTIEREHRSIGSILDQRELYKLSDPPNIRKFTRRIGAENLPDDDVEINQFIELENDTNFDQEEQIWKTKSSNSNYIQKRRYENPELQKFKDSLTSAQQKDFKKRTLEALHDLARKYRQEMILLKRELNSSGVFHSSANAHRVHCMYLMKLYKGIRADTIEDPVLRKLKAEELTKKREEDHEEEKKMKLIRLAEMKTSGAHDDDGLYARPSNLEPINPDEVFQPRRTKSRKALAEPKILNSFVCTRPRASRANIDNSLSLRKSRSLPAMSIPGQQTTSGQVPLQLTKITSKFGSVSVLKDNSHGSLQQVASSDSLQAGTGAALLSGADRLMFYKMRRGRLGNADPRTLLHEEAARLEGAEVSHIRKMRERSDIFDQQISSWLVDSLQQGQISRAAAGKYFVSGDIATREEHTALGGLISSGDDDDPLLGLEKEDVASQHSHNNDQIQHHHSSGNNHTITGDNHTITGNNHTITTTSSTRNPQQIVPFDDFYAMFLDHVAKQEAVEATQAAGTDKFAVVNTVQGEGDVVVSEIDCMESPAPAIPQATNLIQTLADDDVEFDVYMKQALRQRPMGRILHRSTSKAAPKKARHAPALLGRSAVSLSDSKGRPTKEANKGFQNHFRGGLLVGPGLEENSLATDMSSDTGSLDSDADSPSKSVTGFDSAIAPSSTQNSPSAVIGHQLVKSSHTSRAHKHHHHHHHHVKLDKNSQNADAQQQPLTMQAKLQSVWECLQVPMQGQLSFMRKYSTDGYSVELCRATDCWAEAAVFVLARIQVLRLFKKIKGGFSVMPVLASELSSSFFSRLPLLLSSPSEDLVPSTLHVGASTEELSGAGGGQIPLSARAVEEVKRIFECIFSSCQDEVSALCCVGDVGRTIDECLQGALKRTREEVDDVVTFGDSFVKDWMTQDRPWATVS